MEDPHRRRIELQAPADFTYLLDNIRATAQQKLDAAFPQSAAPQRGDDALRSKVEQLVQQVRHAYSASIDSLPLAADMGSVRHEDSRTRARFNLDQWPKCQPFPAATCQSRSRPTFTDLPRRR